MTLHSPINSKYLLVEGLRVVVPSWFHTFVLSSHRGCVKSLFSSLQHLLTILQSLLSILRELLTILQRLLNVLRELLNVLQPLLSILRELLRVLQLLLRVLQRLLNILREPLNHQGLKDRRIELMINDQIVNSLIVFYL